MSDVLDILEVDRGSAAATEINKDRIIGPQRVSRKPGSTRGSRRPEGINRELYNLLYTDNKDPPPLLPAQDGQSRNGRRLSRCSSFTFLLIELPQRENVLLDILLEMGIASCLYECMFLVLALFPATEHR